MEAAHATPASRPANGIYIPKWAWGLIAGTLFTLLTGAVGWLSYIAGMQNSIRESVAALKAAQELTNRRLDRIEKQLDDLIRRSAR